MLKVGSLVMVRDPWIKFDYHELTGQIIEIEKDPVLLRTRCRVEFENGLSDWFDSWSLKTQ